MAISFGLSHSIGTAAPAPSSESESLSSTTGCFDCSTDGDSGRFTEQNGATNGWFAGGADDFPLLRGCSRPCGLIDVQMSTAEARTRGGGTNLDPLLLSRPVPRLVRLESSPPHLELERPARGLSVFTRRAA